MVYVIEDDANVRRSLELLLGSYELKCKLFNTGKEFLDQYSKNNHDVVILDLKMADMESKDFLQLLKEANIRIPIIGITAHDDPFTRAYCRDFGVTNIMSKPVDSKALMDIVRYYG